MPAAEEQATFRTDDLALAAYLLTRGWTHARMVQEGTAAMWEYDQPGGSASADGEFSEDVREYFRGEAFVEPREFMRKVGSVRKGLYSFLGVRAKRVAD